MNTSEKTSRRAPSHTAFGLAISYLRTTRHDSMIHLPRAVFPGLTIHIYDDVFGMRTPENGFRLNYELLPKDQFGNLECVTEEGTQEVLRALTDPAVTRIGDEQQGSLRLAAQQEAARASYVVGAHAQAAARHIRRLTENEQPLRVADVFDRIDGVAERLTNTYTDRASTTNGSAFDPTIGLSGLLPR